MSSQGMSEHYKTFLKAKTKDEAVGAVAKYLRTSFLHCKTVTFHACTCALRGLWPLQRTNRLPALCERRVRVCAFCLSRAKRAA